MITLPTKAELKLKWRMLIIFLKQFFNWRDLAFATFTYEISGNHKRPKREEHIVLARVNRNATAELVTKKLFKLKAPDKMQIKVLGVKLLPVGKIEKV